MYLLIIGFLLVLLKFMDINPVSQWSWWWVLSPFIIILIWWEVIERVFKLREKREEAKLVEERKERLDRLMGKKK
ncbi:MAG: TIGR04438 family Trp-rich protein [Betaproteobacteria bacterium]|nr:TIGR04438 family Trp-rich protein [Betaproteobacteria bacterium]